ncbi:sulfite exporter TauE/SafE family protein [Natronosporangium hydrolyticum]|uniref:Probable membrane transporter protein n=1 Tax=Natronosporangium hydrolyticum TaxID=2811111 RepID=A0A895YJD2_9ACTN|nr:sulfite exporter TauE/SafE family protein [Natronosporangium hydrolyticum]QSB16142.1 sulfite exporter TauE/SafE family protein [Natronosporangium hydrolyticum]
MPALLLLGLVGFGAQMINSALGMGYGVTSTTFLLTLGTAPALASATVNFSQVGSQFVSGLAHWRFGNVDWQVVWRIAIPGAVGAFAGATFLSWLATEHARPIMSGILLGLGTYILIRFTLRGTPRGKLGKPLRSRFLTPLGLVGGFMNSTGGGGWGPVGTTALLASGRLEPRKVIGSISAAEFAVVVAGSAGFLVGLGLGGVNLAWVAVMLLGGVLAAPIAAWLARHIPPRMLGSLTGGLIVVTNVRTLFVTETIAAPPVVRATTYLVLALLWAGAVGWSARAHRLTQRAEQAQRAAEAAATPAGSPAPVGGGQPPS